MTVDYRYNPLTSKNSIRVLKLPYSDQDNTQRRLVEVSLRRPPKFIALSYSWGASKVLYKSRVAVEANPFVSRPTCTTSWFISSAVIKISGRFMGRRPLYRPGQHPGAKCAGRAHAQYLQHSRTRRRVARGTYRSEWPCYGKDPLILVCRTPAAEGGGDPRNISDMSQRGLKSLCLPQALADEYLAYYRHLLEREWYKRVWIVQEVAMARKLEIGVDRGVYPGMTLPTRFPSHVNYRGGWGLKTAFRSHHNAARHKASYPAISANSLKVPTSIKRKGEKISTLIAYIYQESCKQHVFFADVLKV